MEKEFTFSFSSLQKTPFYFVSMTVMLTKLKKVIEFYEWCWGQKMKSDKSTLCSINIEENELAATAASLKVCSVRLKGCLFYILAYHWGCPKQISFWQPVINMVQAKLDKWK